MNKFNKVFLVVKAQCEKQKKVAELSNFEAIANEAKIPLADLDGYLKYLQDSNLIRYSMEGKYLYLTSFGMKTDSLTKE